MGTFRLADRISFNSEANACSQALQWKRAWAVLNLMGTSEGLEPDIVSYSTAILALERSTDSPASHQSVWRSALAVLRAMTQHDVEPGVTALQNSVRTCKYGRAWEAAL